MTSKADLNGHTQNMQGLVVGMNFKWSRAPLLLDNHLMRDISEKTMEIIGNHEFIAVNEDPLGVPGYKKVRCEGGDVEVWAGPLSGYRVTVLLVNWGGWQIAATGPTSASQGQCRRSEGSVVECTPEAVPNLILGEMTNIVVCRVEAHPNILILGMEG